MAATTDDLEAVRTLVATLDPFEPKERERIIRWAREKLGMVGGSATIADPVGLPAGSPAAAAAAATAGARDIKTFVAQKNPKSDQQFAATVAYYHQFEAPPAERKDAISKEDFVEACRKVDRKRPASPAQVLVNAYHAGIFDRGDRGVYRLNSVGENLVAMVLPEGGGGANGGNSPAKPRHPRSPRKGTARSAGRRRAKGTK